MPSIFKFLGQRQAERYVLPLAEDLVVEEDTLPEQPPPPTAEAAEVAPSDASPVDPTAPEKEESPPEPKEDPIQFAQIQAEAILQDARQEAEAYKEQARQEAAQEIEEARAAARRDGYSRGFTEGMAEANAKAKMELEKLSAEQIADVRTFLEEATRQRDQLLDENREELKDLALAIAEKVIRVSLRGSSDILLRMVDAATDTHKRCEWAHIYIADCDVKGKVNAIPELTRALRHLSNRVKVIPMADDESGTCIVELPDVIMDASVSTQLGNIREVLKGAALDKDTRHV